MNRRPMTSAELDELERRLRDSVESAEKSEHNAHLYTEECREMLQEFLDNREGWILTPPKTYAAHASA